MLPAVLGISRARLCADPPPQKKEERKKKFLECCYNKQSRAPKAWTFDSLMSSGCNHFQEKKRGSGPF